MLLSIVTKQDIFGKTESVKRGRESVRLYLVQLAELFQLVGLASSFSGTVERAGARDICKDGGKEKQQRGAADE